MLPKSILHPPRHSLTLPFPTSSLRIHTGSVSDAGDLNKDGTGTNESNKDKERELKRKKERQHGQSMMPYVHYAPIHVKGITTTIPADGNARKQKRLEEVRQRRRDAKEKRKLDRRKT